MFAVADYINLRQQLAGPGCSDIPEAAAMTAMGREGEAVPTNVIYNAGFYVGDQEVEPKAPVNVTVQVLQDGFAAGEPIKIADLIGIVADTGNLAVIFHADY